MEKLVELNDKLMGAPAGVLVFFMCISIGYVWKMVAILPNRFIPALVMFNGAVLFLLLSWKTSVGVASGTRNFVIGFIIGFVSWLAHKLVLKRIEQKLGLFATGGTEPITKEPPKGTS